MQKQYSHIILDFDGVILDSMRVWDNAIERIFRKTGKDCPKELMQRTSGLTVKDRLRACFQKLGIPIDDQFQEYIEEIYRDARTALREDPILVLGVEDFIRTLKESGYILGLVSSSGQALIETVLARHDLNQYFSVIVDFYDVTQHKPDPEPYLIALSKLKIDSENVLVFEDSVHGVKSAVTAGCDVVGIMTSRIEEDLKESGAFLTIQDFKDDRLQQFFGVIGG